MSAPNLSDFSPNTRKQFARWIDKTIPAPESQGPMDTAEKVAKFNWEMGRRSAANDLIAMLNKTAETALENIPSAD